MSAQPYDAGNPSGGYSEDLPDYGFESDAGNAAMIRVLADVEQLARRGELDRRGTVEALSDGVRRIGRDYPEASEMPVRIAVVAALDPLFAEQGWEKLEPGEF